MRPAEQLDQIGVHEMSFDEFERHALLCCVRTVDGVAGARVESIDAPGYVDVKELRNEISRSFASQDYPKSEVGNLTDRLVHEMVGVPFPGHAWHVRLDRAKTVVLVKSDAALTFSPREVLRGVYSDACSEALAERNGQISNPINRADPMNGLSGLNS